MKKLLALFFLFTPLFCHASGYALYEMNAAANGMAHAYICRVDDASAIWYNPAALTRIEGNNVYASGTWFHTTGDFTSLATGGTTDRVTGNFFPPNVYMAHQISDNLVLGAGFYTPFGLTTEWPATSTVSFVSQKASLRTYYITPSVGYKITPNISVGGGVDFVFGSVELDRNISIPPITFINNIDADGSDFGYNLAVLVQTDSNIDFAVTYKSKVDVDFSGDANFVNVPDPIRPLFPDTQADVTLPMPAQLMFGVSTTYEKLSIEANLDYTQWDAFDAIRVNFDANTPALRDQITLRNYDNTWAFRLGAEYSLTDQWKIRGGYAYDDTPVPDKAVDPILPDSVRNNVSFGAGYKSGPWKADVSFMLVTFNDRKSPLDNFVNPPGNQIAAGKYTNGAGLLAFGFGYSF